MNGSTDDRLDPGDEGGPLPLAALVPDVSAGRLPVSALARGASLTLTPVAAEPAASRLITPPIPVVQRLARRGLAPRPVTGSVSVAGLWDTLVGADEYDGEFGRALDHEGERPSPADIPLWKRLARILQPPVDLILRTDGPVTWPAPLFPYQLDGVQALLTKPALLLADDMGLGKTIQAIAALRILMLQHRVAAALVVAPAGLITQWRVQLDLWAPELRVTTVRGDARDRVWQWKAPAHVALTSYETLRADFAEYGAASPGRRHWDVVLLDEAQRIKNRDSELSWLCKLLPRRRAWALTGTPLENSLDDLASIMEFVTPLAPGQSPPVWLEGPALRARHASVQLRRRKSDVLRDLPPKTVHRVRLRLDGGQRQSYDLAEREGVLALRERGAGLRVQHVLDLVVRLKQICNVCPRTGQSAKLDDLTERLDTLRAEGHRALIFSQFTDERFGVRAIAARVRALSPLVYTGDMSMAARDRVIEQFKSHPDRGALILSLRAGGQGLNLAEASYVVHFDRWWNPAVERQAEDRSHRLGQTVPVTVYNYVCEDTIEQRIDDILRSKQAMFDEVVDDVTLDAAEHVGADELLALFGLQIPGPLR
jgi:SNF2 family DNA or RNA helicase